MSFGIRNSDFGPGKALVASRTESHVAASESIPKSEIRNPKSEIPVIGLLGGIGSGKTFVAGLFAERGGYVISADPLAHEALRQPEIRDQVVTIFGAECLGPNGEIERKRLAGPVFADASLRRQLEALIFPWVGTKVAGLIEQARANPAVRFIVLDAPVMLEAGWNNVCDRLVYVDAPREIRLARIAQRGWTPNQVSAREKAQMSLEEKARRADAIVDNGGSAERTAREVDELLNRWKLQESHLRLCTDV